MAHHKIEIQCKSCKGTGLYVGMCERGGAAVVCVICEGTGQTTLEYDTFEGRKERDDISWVLEANPGIVIGEGKDLQFRDFGGMTYLAWKNGRFFNRGLEMRNFTCPAWWFQAAASDKPPRWDECVGPGGSFPNCDHFEQKEKCWRFFDCEQKALEAKHEQQVHDTVAPDNCKTCGFSVGKVKPPPGISKSTGLRWKCYVRNIPTFHKEMVTDCCWWKPVLHLRGNDNANNDRP